MNEQQIKNEWTFLKLKSKDLPLGKAYVATYGFNEFPDVILQENPVKNADCYVINRLKNEPLNRKTRSFRYPVFVFFDIDLKVPELKEQWVKMTGCSIEEFLEKLKDDPWVYISGHSTGGKGIRIIYMVLNQYLLGVDETLDEKLLKHIHRSNYNYVLNEHLTKTYGINQFKGLDKAASVLTQPTFPIRRNGYHHVNLNCRVFHHSVEEYQFETKVLTHQVSFIDESVFVDDIGKSNNDNVLAGIVTHYNFKILCMLSKAPDNIKQLFFRLYCKYYDGDSLPIPPRGVTFTDDELNVWYRNFVKFINIKTKTAVSFPTLESILIQYRVVIPQLKEYNEYFEDGCDSLFNKYDMSLKYMEYISEDAPQLDKIIEDNSNVVVKAPAGGGKTKYCVDTLNKDLTINVFAAPKNSVNIQLYNKYKDTYPLTRNYTDDSHRPNWREHIGPQVIVSSLQSMFRLKNAGLVIDKLVVDEVHNLTFYSKLNKKAFVIPEVKHRINISATPEAYLIGEQDYFYVNLEPLLNHKTKADLYYSNQPVVSALHRYSPQRKQMFLLNDKAQCVKMRKMMMDRFPDNIVHLINSDTKNDIATIQLMEHQNLLYNTYIVTDYVSEGVNILNADWGEIIIIDNYTGTFFSFYQMSMRFRLATVVVVNIFMGPCKTDKVPKLDEFKRDYAKKLNDNFNERLANLQKVCDQLNQIHLVYDISRDDFYNQFFYCDNNGIYQVNKDRVKKWVFDDFHRLIRNNTHLNNLYLGHLFDLTVYNEYEKRGVFPVIRRNKVNSIFMKYPTEFIKIKDLITDGGAIPEQYAKLEEVYTKNQKYIDKLVGRYTEIIKYEPEPNLKVVTANEPIWESYLQKSIMKFIPSQQPDYLGKLDTLLQQNFTVINDVVVKHSKYVDRYGTSRANLMEVQDIVCGMNVVNSTLYSKKAMDKSTFKNILTKYGFSVKRVNDTMYVYPLVV